MNQQSFTKFSWGLYATFISIAVIAWGSGFSWDIGSLSAFKLFPLFGIVAWLIMAGHYYTGTLRVLHPELKKPAYYKKVTGYTVLASLLLHPAILIVKLAKNGQGLPPNSYVNYVGEGLKLAVFLGTFSLILFLSFEVFERIKNRKTIQKYWWLVSLSQSFAMLLIWIHGLRLGTDLGDGWFRFLWVLFGIALLPCFYIIHRADFQQKDQINSFTY